MEEEKEENEEEEEQSQFTHSLLVCFTFNNRAS